MALKVHGIHLSYIPYNDIPFHKKWVNLPYLYTCRNFAVFSTFPKLYTLETGRLHEYSSFHL